MNKKESPESHKNPTLDVGFFDFFGKIYALTHKAKNMKKYLFLIVTVTLAGCLFIKVPGTNARGLLVKGSLPAVYYIADDGNRYVFPNEKIYFSWYEDFSEVSEISDQELAEYPIGGNITYRPGTRLIKLTSTPTVYAVEPGGILRPIANETVAKNLYGTSWASRVDDLSDSFFSSYKVGASLSGDFYPEGSLLFDSGNYYVISNGQRRLLNETAIEENAYQTSFAINADTSKYSDGYDVTGEETTLSDTSEHGIGADQDVDVKVQAGRNASTILQDSSLEVIGVFTFSFAEKTSIKKLKVQMQAVTNSDSDADAGGLIRGDGSSNIEANIKNVRFLDIEGNQILGTANLLVQEDLDGTQNLLLSGSEEFEAGWHTLFLTIETSEDATIDEQYYATLILNESEFEVNDVTTTDITPESISGLEVVMKSSNLTIGIASGSESSSILHGQAGPHEVIGFEFTNYRSETITVKSLTLTGFIDENEGDSDFQEGLDSDTGSQATFVSDVISQVQLILESDSSVLGTSTSIQSNGHITFSDLDIEIRPKESEIVLVQVEVNENAPFGQNSDYIAFDFIDVENNVKIEDESGDAVDVNGEAVNGGTSPNYYLTVAKSGSLTINGNGYSYPRLLFGSERNQVYYLNFEASEEEDIIVDTLTVYLSDPSAEGSVESVELEYTDDEGTYYAQGNLSVGNVTFNDLGIVVPKGSDIDANVLIDISLVETGAESGDEIAFNFEPATFVAKGAVSGIRLTHDDFGDKLTNNTIAGTSSTVRKNEPIIALSDDQPKSDQDRTDETEIFNFSMHTNGEGRSEINKITFQIQPSDVGYELNNVSEDNDLLEYLADVNGDTADDNDVAELIDLETGDTLGEGADGHIDFYIYDESTGLIDTTPAGLDTASGDYGLLVYEFTNPISLYGTERNYSFSLNTTGLAIGVQTIQISILDDDDFLWSDGTWKGRNENGVGITTLPLDGQKVTFQ